MMKKPEDDQTHTGAHPHLSDTKEWDYKALQYTGIKTNSTKRIKRMFTIR